MCISAGANQFGFFVNYQETQHYRKTHSNLKGKYWEKKKKPYSMRKQLLDFKSIPLTQK